MEVRDLTKNISYEVQNNYRLAVQWLHMEIDPGITGIMYSAPRSQLVVSRSRDIFWLDAHNPMSVQRRECRISSPGFLDLPADYPIANISTLSETVLAKWHDMYDIDKVSAIVPPRYMDMGSYFSPDGYDGTSAFMVDTMRAGIVNSNDPAYVLVNTSLDITQMLIERCPDQARRRDLQRAAAEWALFMVPRNAWNSTSMADYISLPQLARTRYIRNMGTTPPVGTIHHPYCTLPRNMFAGLVEAPLREPEFSDSMFETLYERLKHQLRQEVTGAQEQFRYYQNAAEEAKDSMDNKLRLSDKLEPNKASRRAFLDDASKDGWEIVFNREVEGWTLRKEHCGLAMECEDHTDRLLPDLYIIIPLSCWSLLHQTRFYAVPIDMDDGIHGYFDSYQAHPHCPGTAGPNPCLGDYESMLHMPLETINDLRAYEAVVLAFLRTWNPNDDAGRRYIEWPTVDGTLTEDEQRYRDSLTEVRNERESDSPYIRGRERRLDEISPPPTYQIRNIETPEMNNGTLRVAGEMSRVADPGLATARLIRRPGEWGEWRIDGLRDTSPARAITNDLPTPIDESEEDDEENDARDW